MTNTALLTSLGFKRAAERVDYLKTRKRKLAMAYEHFRFVTEENIDAFNAKLRKETEKKEGGYPVYDRLAFIRIADYEKVPPTEALEKVADAQKLNCFDSFEVAYIESVKEIPDPIIFGRVESCPDRFFIAQWDDDVKIEDILKENEG